MERGCIVANTIKSSVKLTFPSSNIRFPGTLNTIFDRLIGRAETCVGGQSTLGFVV